MKFKDWLTLIYVLLGIGVLVGAFFLVKKIANLVATGLPWWKALFGFATPGAQIPDITGAAGQAASDKAKAAAAAADAPQLQYDRARSTWAKARSLSAAWDDLLGNGWPWRSFDDWKAAGMPSLPT